MRDEECDPIKYMKRYNSDVAVVAEKMCLYWKHRVQVFGRDRAFLPLLLAGDAALTKTDVIGSLHHGLPLICPDTDSGTKVVLFDANYQTFYSKTEHILRGLFYLQKELAKDDKTITDGYILLIQVITPRFNQFDQPLYERVMTILDQAFPTKPHAHFMLGAYSLAGGLKKQHFRTQDVLGKALEFAIQKDLFFSREVHIHRAGDEDKMAITDLERMGITRKVLPAGLYNGFFELKSVLEWVEKMETLDEARWKRIRRQYTKVPKPPSENLSTAHAKAERKQVLDILHSRRKRERRKNTEEKLKEELDQLLSKRRKLLKEEMTLYALMDRFEGVAARVEAHEENISVKSMPSVSSIEEEEGNENESDQKPSAAMTKLDSQRRKSRPFIDSAAFSNCSHTVCSSEASELSDNGASSVEAATLAGASNSSAAILVDAGLPQSLEADSRNLMLPSQPPPSVSTPSNLLEAIQLLQSRSMSAEAANASQSTHQNSVDAMNRISTNDVRIPLGHGSESRLQIDPTPPSQPAASTENPLVAQLNGGFLGQMNASQPEQASIDNGQLQQLLASHFSHPINVPLGESALMEDRQRANHPVHGASAQQQGLALSSQAIAFTHQKPNNTAASAFEGAANAVGQIDLINQILGQLSGAATMQQVPAVFDGTTAGSTSRPATSASTPLQMTVQQSDMPLSINEAALNQAISLFPPENRARALQLILQMLSRRN